MNDLPGCFSYYVFWDSQGVIYEEYLSKGQRINADIYAETLFNLQKAIKTKHPGNLLRRIVLLHDNAQPHTASSQLLFSEISSGICQTPLHYSTNLAPSDYHLFPALKNHLSGQQFMSDDEVKITASQYFKQLDSKFYKDGIGKLVL